MKLAMATCHSCGLVQYGIATYLDCDGEPVRDELRQCGGCGSYNLAFEERDPGSTCDCCGAEDGYRYADICVCGQHLCPTCRAAHENCPHLCAGRFVPLFSEFFATEQFGNPNSREEEGR